MSEWCQLVSNDDLSFSSTTPANIGLKFESGHVVCGNTINTVKVFLKINSGSPTGDITMTVKEDDGTLIGYSDSLDASTVTGSMVEYTFTFATAPVLPVDGTIRISGSAMTSGRVAWASDGTTAGTDNEVYTYDSAGNPSLVSDTIMKLCVTYGGDPPPATSTVTMPPPPAWVKI